MPTNLSCVFWAILEKLKAWRKLSCTAKTCRLPLETHPKPCCCAATVVICVCSSQQCRYSKGKQKKNGCLIISFLVSHMAFVWTLIKHVHLCFSSHKFIDAHTFVWLNHYSASLFCSTSLLPSDSLACPYFCFFLFNPRPEGKNIYFCLDYICAKHCKCVSLLIKKKLNCKIKYIFCLPRKQLYTIRHNISTIVCHNNLWLETFEAWTATSYSLKK